MSDEDDEREIPSDSAPEVRRRRLDSAIGELVKRAVEIGVEKAQEAPDNLKHFLHERKLPKDFANVVSGSVDDAKEGIFRVVAAETRQFLERLNLAQELKSLLTSVKFEIHTTVRFSPNDAKPDVKVRTGKLEDDAPPEPDGKRTKK